MPETLEDLIMMQPPTPERPLLGTMILLVEDSRHACEVLRMICQRSGARIRRAESLASAARHLRSYRPRIVVIDLGLPDGSGLELIETLAMSEPGIDGIIAISGRRYLGRCGNGGGGGYVHRQAPDLDPRVSEGGSCDLFCRKGSIRRD